FPILVARRRMDGGKIEDIERAFPTQLRRDGLADVEIHMANPGVGESRLDDVDAVEPGVTSTGRETSQKMAADEPGSAEHHGLSIEHNRVPSQCRQPSSVNITQNRPQYRLKFMSLLLPAKTAVKILTHNVL